MSTRVRQRIAFLSSTVFFICAFVLIATDSPSGQSVYAASSTSRGDHRGIPSGSKPARVKAAPASLALVTVHDVRVAAGPDKTRLVLDLDRHAKVIERRAHNPSRIVIALPNASMSRSAQIKASNGTIPPPFVVKQTKTPAVAVSLPLAAIRTYKQFTLSDPPRLVIDVIPSSKSRPSSSSEAPKARSLSAPSPIQPAMPPDKGYQTIVIDPGHGGRDPGARGPRRTVEKDITLKVGLKLRELLRKQPGVRVLMTRDRDVFVDLENRANFANSNEADLFVSIHVNSHPSRSIKGLEIYHFGEAKDQRALEVAARENGTPLNSTGVGWEYLVADLLTTKKIEASLELAWTTREAMVTHINKRYAIKDHGVKTAPFYVLRFTSMPSILAEIAYISNPTEEKLLRKPAFTQTVAQSLFKGINSFLANNKR